jgi:hypothetical protein
MVAGCAAQTHPGAKIETTRKTGPQCEETDFFLLPLYTQANRIYQNHEQLGSVKLSSSSPRRVTPVHQKLADGFALCYCIPLSVILGDRPHTFQ